MRTILLASLAAALPLTAAPLRYNRDIRPLLSDNCFHCHGPDRNHRKGGLRLDLREEALKPAKSGERAIVPGKPEDSELIKRIHHSDPDELMPPADAHKVLSTEQKARLSRWIAEGAAYESHWAYTPVVRPAVPEVKQAGAIIKNPIDAFIQQPLLESGIAPASRAESAVLIRRLCLDLIGLPPTPAETGDFVRTAAGGDSAWTALCDRLLSSPHYGERMAQAWLDVVRYADTVGYHGDQNFNAWPYRDWVIDAFNANQRFDAFTMEQIAGDLLPQPDERQLTATCFNRLNMMTREGGAQPGEYLAKYTADRVRTVSMAWMGATSGCAECHDHKFDPWTQKDFYSLGAFFADVKQWGVYNDYSYTPNPDLKGWSNDHPFPPERFVTSEALVRRIALLDEQAGALLDAAAKKAAGNPDRAAAFRAWTAANTEFLAKHPDGWSAPEPEVEESAGKAGAKKGKRQPKRVTAEPAPAAEGETTVHEDGRIIFAKGGARDAQITLPGLPVVAAVRIELLPVPEHGNSVSRSGAAVTLKPVFERISPDGKKQALTIRYADAGRKRPRYANGFEIQGIQDGWTTADGGSGEPHTGVWLLENPAAFAAGESLRITIPDNPAGCLRCSLSPFPRLQPASPALPEGMAAQLAESGDAAWRWFIRSTPGDPVLREVHRLERERFDCRDGRTPVMVTERSAKPLTIRVLARGNWQDESGEVCRPATPAFLPGLPDAAGRELTRLDLAKWITSRSNPLTARVIMNRLWKQFFGTALSAQTDDLGAQGENPSHPELLDWLAAEFMDCGWDYRHMVRLIVSSHTYQQSSQPRAEMRESDPLNRRLAAQNPRRLEAENVRDNALAIAGLLNPAMGGPPVKPYQPDDYYSGLQFPDRRYTADTGIDQWRRGIYTHWQRTFLHPMLANFDAPSREDCVALRTAANTPQQALTLLNDPSFVEAARVWAVSVLASAGSDGDRIDAAFHRALGRPAAEKEKSGLLAFLTSVRAEYRARPDDAAKLLNTGLAPKAGADADKVELAAWTSVCRVILNLHETITRF